MKKLTYMIFTGLLLLSITGLASAQDTATDTTKLPDQSTATGTSDLSKGGEAIGEAGRQRHQKEDFYANPENAPIPGDN